MSVFFDKKRQRWYYNFTLKKQRYSGYCQDPKTGELAKNKTEAKKHKEMLRARLMAGHGSRSVLPGAFTLAEAMAALVAQSEGEKNLDRKLRMIDEILKYFGFERPVTQVSNEAIWEYIKWSRRKPIEVWLGGPCKLEELPDYKVRKGVWKTRASVRSDARINKYLAIISRCASRISTSTP